MRPAAWTLEVDQLARRQIGGEALLGLGLDGRPAVLGDRCEFSQKMVHHSLPLRLPIPSESPPWLRAGGSALAPDDGTNSASASISVIGAVENK